LGEKQKWGYMDFYTTNAQRLSQQYDSLSPEQVHAAWLSHLPAVQPTSNKALDLGAGSGRDAAWLASMGWDVLAVEPSSGLRDIGRESTAQQSVSWLDDTLPQLADIQASYDTSFRLILASAMWMHLTPEEQVTACERLQQLAADDAVIVITWRNQANERERVFHTVDTEQFGKYFNSDSRKSTVTITVSVDEGGRAGIVWHCAVIKVETMKMDAV
jgi:2-polyprenyl-3-methyl-5-hydroxy-6-metoxy-1,4-benzoquinol methylase